MVCVFGGCFKNAPHLLSQSAEKEERKDGTKHKNRNYSAQQTQPEEDKCSALRRKTEQIVSQTLLRNIQMCPVNRSALLCGGRISSSSHLPARARIPTEALQHPLRIHGSSCALLIRAPCSSAAQRAPNPAQQTAEHPPLLQPRASINKTRPARTDPSAVHRHNSSFTSQKKQNNTRQSASSGGLGYFKSFTHPIEPPSAFRSRGGVSRLDARRPSASPSSLSTAGRSAVQSWRQPLVLGVRPDQLLTRHSSHVSHPLFRKPRPLTPPAPPPAPERSAAAQLAAAAVCSQPRRRNRLHTL